MRVGRTVVVIATLLAAGVVGLMSRDAGAVQTPVEMNFACALKSNGLMRYVSNLNQCKSTEDKVTIKPGPVKLCIQPSGSVRRVTNFSSCKPPATQLTLPPASGTVYFCAWNTSGVLRYVTSPSQCTSNEFPVFVTPNDQAPSVTSTSPANGADHVAVNANITVNFSESVTASASSFTLQCPSGTPKTFTVTGSPSNAITLDPTADLPQGTTCAVKVIANQISDTDSNDPPDNMAADYNFSFTTDSAPTVTSTSPANGATAVNPSNNITVSFSEAVTASGSSFTIECPSGSPQSFSVSGSPGSTITLDPSSDLPASTTCTVTVLASGITDVDGGDPPDNLAANYVFSFTTADAAPSVTSTSPADGATHVAVNTNVVVNFSEPVTASGSSFTLECPTGTPESFTVSGSPGSSITLDPTSNLPEGTICSVTVIANQISDVDSVDPPDNMAADYNFSFTTDAAPAVTSTTPADNATDVDPSANITVDFSEAVDVTTSSFTISCDSNPQTFSVSGSGTSSITLDPSSDLPSTSSCTVTAVAANISDTDTGDPPDHPASNTSFSFTTQDAAPSVTSTSPADGATDVAKNANIDINFSEPVTATGSSFTLECPTGSAQAFTVLGSPGSTITLDPNADLPNGTVCTVTVIANQISDVDAIDPPDHMAANYVFSFTVVTNQAPTDINLSNSSVNENQPSGTTVGTLSTTDPDAGDTFTYSLVSGTGDTDNGSFTITGDTLKTNAVFDFETKSSYSIRVQTTDSGSLTFEKVFTISVNNVNEAPTDIQLSNNDIDENQPSNTTIGVLTATDPDTGQTHTFSLQSSGCSGSFPDNASFTISGGDLKSAVSFNYEVKNSYTICVRTTDSGSPAQSFDKQFTITINDVNDPPVAVADGPYNGVIGNTLAVLGTTGSGPKVVLTGNVLISNDTDEDATFPHTLSAVAETPTSTGGGTATINTDGSFTFLPGVGDKNQNDTFTYHVTDGTATTAGTVTVHIEDFLVWYVDNASAAATHDGRSSSPFLNLSSLNAAGGSGDSDGTGDYIFLYQGSGSYGGGIPLEATQKLYGEKHGLTVNSINLVSAGATAPVITNASGTGVGLANGVDVQGLNISGTSGDAVNGVAVTTATVGTSTAVNISSAGGDGVDLSGAASGNISIASPITGSAGHSVAVSGRSGGTTSFSGAISDTGTGITLQNNSGATINLTGGVTASTGSSNAFNASGGGTVNVTGSANTLATTTGTALNVSSTNIGSSGLNFRSIASNGALSGIVLSSTGSSGGLTVSGTGSAGTGGTIQNSSNSGILAFSTTNLSLSFMNLQNNGDAVNEGGIRMTDVTGTSGITSSTVNGGFEDNIYLRNDTSTALTFTIQGPSCSITNNSSASGNNGINILAATSANLTATVDGCSFSGNRAVTIGADSADNSTLNVTITNNTITQGSPNHGNQGIQVSDAANGSVTFLVNGNKVGTPDGTTASPLMNTGINIFNGTAGNAVMAGRVSNNTVLNDPTFAVGVSNGFGIRVFNSNLAQIRAKVLSNTVKNVNTDYGILAESSGAASAPAAPHGRLDVDIESNNVTVNTGALDAIRAQARNFSTVCSKIVSNTAPLGGVGFFGIFVRQANSAVFDLDGWNGVGLPETYVVAQNPGSTAGSAGTITGVAANTCDFTGVP